MGKSMITANWLMLFCKFRWKTWAVFLIFDMWWKRPCGILLYYATNCKKGYSESMELVSVHSISWTFKSRFSRRNYSKNEVFLWIVEPFFWCGILHGIMRTMTASWFRFQSRNIISLLTIFMWVSLLNNAIKLMLAENILQNTKETKFGDIWKFFTFRQIP